MGGPVITLALRTQEDVLLTRRRARDLAGFLQLGAEAQSRLATAVWEVARLAHRHGRRARSSSPSRTSRRPPSSPSAASPTGVLTGETPGEALDRLDLAKLRQLVDRVEARDADGAVLVRLTSDLEQDAWVPGLEELSHVMGSLQRHESGEAEAALNELRMQNAELVTALATLSERERELIGLNRELADTNRAVTALLAELGQQAEELRERAAGNASFLGALTHELRTPLYAVRGMTEAILREGGDACTRACARTSGSSTARWRRRSTSSTTTSTWRGWPPGATSCASPRSTSTSCSARCAASSSTCPARPEVSVVFEDLNGVPTLRTDAFKLSQILRNYVVNGLKFTERGEVRVSAVAVDAGEQVRFAVADTGPGPRGADQAARVRGVRPARPARARPASCAARAWACRSASAWRRCWAARSA